MLKIARLLKHSNLLNRASEQLWKWRRRTLQVEDLVFSMTIKKSWQDIWWMSREEVCWFQNCHFDLQGLLGERYAESQSVKMLWKTEEKSWEIFTSSEVRCHHPSQSRWVIENDGDFYTDQSAWEWSSRSTSIRTPYQMQRGKREGDWIRGKSTLEIQLLCSTASFWCLGIW